MKHFTFVEPGEDGVTPVVVVVSEEEILATYYEYWQEQMRKVGKADMISEPACLEDWMAVHWAVEMDEAE